MKFRGYKLTFELHAAHTNLQFAPDQFHYHTFSIVLWIKRKDENVDIFDDMEKTVKDFLSRYEDTYLGDTELFKESDLTVESMGDIFFRELKKLINNERFELLRLDVWENPVRQYSVSTYRMDMNIHPLNISMLLGVHQTKMPATQPSQAKLSEPMEQESLPPKPMAVGQIDEAKETDENISIQKQIPHKRHFRLKMRWQILLAVSVLAVLAYGLYVMISGGMISLYGSDTLYHLYHSDLLLQEISEGNFFPLYDPSWYNGVEIMRYWGPLPVYLLALIQFLSQGTSLDAYMIMIALSSFIAALGWLRFGIRYQRVALSVAIGIVWFLLPENARLFVLDGNIPRVLLNAIFPHLLYSVWMYLHERNHNSLYMILFLMSCCVLSHLGMAAMVMVSLLLMIIGHRFFVIRDKRWRFAVLGLALPFLLCGIWSVPAMIGGGASKGSATNQVMAYFFEPLLSSLDPMPHIQGDLGDFYIGISVFLLCLLGVVLGHKKERSVFLSALLLLLCTSMTAYELFIKLPFSQFLWMIRFVPFALGLAMAGLLLWDGLRAWIKVVFVLLLCMDAVPSLLYLNQFQGQDSAYTEAYQDRLAAQEGLQSGKAYTTQRLSVMELSGYGAFAPYYIAGVEPKKAYLFGAGWEGSGIADRIVALNSALSYGHYRYLFDRHLELGTDTIVFPISYLARGQRDIEELKQIAEECGYHLMEETSTYLTFHYPIEQKIEQTNFGTKTTYQNLAIGANSADMTMLFPSFVQGESSVIEDYSLQELMNYQVVYLSGFTYQDKQAAENLLREVSEAGVDVIIDMNNIPVVSSTRKQELFGVDAQTYRFSERFPELNYKGQAYRASLFQIDQVNWNAVSLSALDTVDGYGEINEKELVFSGTKENEHLHFWGFNLAYHALITKDNAVIQLLEDMLEVDQTALPKRDIVPLEITYDKRSITILSMEDDVNTSLAALDIMEQDQITVKNRLVHVSSGITVVSLSYPHFKLGLSVSVIGGLLVLLLCRASARARRDNR